MFLALHGVRYARGFSFLGRNVSFCMSRYNFTFSDVIRRRFRELNLCTCAKFNDTATLVHADLLNETLKIRETI
jgi:hypothetical protein